MAYCSLTDLIARAGADEILQVADRDHDGVADTAVITAAVDQAGTVIDAYLSSRYQLPLVSVPALVIGWAVSIARYHLHRDGAPDYVVRDYRDALAALKDAQAGRLSLPDAAGPSATVATIAGGLGVGGDQPVFSPGALAGWL